MTFAINSPDEAGAFLRHALERVHVPRDHEVGALFSVAFSLRGDDDLYFLTGRCVFETQHSVSRRDKYPEMLLDEWWAPTDEAIATIVSTMKGEGRLNGIAAPPLHLPSVRRQIGERPSFTGWPEWILDASASRTGEVRGPSSEPLVRQGTRPYSTGTQAIVDWVWRAPTKEASHQPYENRLIVVVPDYRARINSAEWRGRKVMVDVDGPESGLELQCLVLSSGTHRSLPPVVSPPVSGATTFEVPEGTERVELFLVRAESDLADRVTLYTPGEEFEAGAGEPSPEERAASELRAGEGQEIEYKPFVARSDPKEEEIVRTIVAFANTDGGRVYVGVTDQGVPEGETALCRAAQAAAGPALKVLTDRVQKLIRERIKPTTETEVYSVRVFGEPVIVIDVASSANGPFSTHENDVYVRKGATNRKPDPKTELPGIGGRGLGIVFRDKF